MHRQHQLQAGQVLGQAGAQGRHHLGAGAHQRHPPLHLGGVLEQAPGQFNAGAAAHAPALAGQGPNHAGAIGDHQLGGGDRLAQGPVGPGGHGHLGIEGDDLAAAALVQGQSRGKHVRADRHGHPQHGQLGEAVVMA